MCRDVIRKDNVEKVMMTKEEVKALGILVSVKNDSVRSEEYLHLYFLSKYIVRTSYSP